MPYASKAQMRKFHSDPRLRKHAKQWDAETEKAGGFGKLPDRKDAAKSAARKVQRNPQFAAVAHSAAKAKGKKKFPPQMLALAKKMQQGGGFKKKGRR